MTMHHSTNKSKWGISKAPVLQTAIHSFTHLPFFRRQLSRKPYLVHRLDHRTSGAVIVGFDSKSAGVLHGRLRGGEARKLYVALVRGDLRERFRQAAADGCCDGGLSAILPERNDVEEASKMKNVEKAQTYVASEYTTKITVDLPINVKVDGVDVEKDATTDFYFIASMCLDEDDSGRANDDTAKVPFTNKAVSLILCHPITGRTHQIRRHARKAFSSPVVGDREHGDSRVNRFWREKVGLDRLTLHCWYLDLPQAEEDCVEDRRGVDAVMEEVSKTRIQCMAPLPPDFATALKHEKLKPLWEEVLRMEPRLAMEPYDERGVKEGGWEVRRVT
ncbi:predicted protein [Thalassiosira pseudonana CCMP1335]|uniref:Pseudouridine synthase RsuA/RluA-like domain-containing protein n=1 Tax=Thalassiosira pseudonana TaxID=35128 RepID=B8LCC0_THAPS|nr:predicted protein [Thalassiosira pseudonana CCMP1335]EED86957.1 predicted protein [Thalassiosira pseudonana CCMP1335]